MTSLARRRRARPSGNGVHGGTQGRMWCRQAGESFVLLLGAAKIAVGVRQCALQAKVRGIQAVRRARHRLREVQRRGRRVGQPGRRCETVRARCPGTRGAVDGVATSRRVSLGPVREVVDGVHGEIVSLPRSHASAMIDVSDTTGRGPRRSPSMYEKLVRRAAGGGATSWTRVPKGGELCRLWLPFEFCILILYFTRLDKFLVFPFPSPATGHPLGGGARSGRMAESESSWKRGDGHTSD